MGSSQRHREPIPPLGSPCPQRKETLSPSQNNRAGGHTDGPHTCDTRPRVAGPVHTGVPAAGRVTLSWPSSAHPQQRGLQDTRAWPHRPWAPTIPALPSLHRQLPPGPDVGQCMHGTAGPGSRAKPNFKGEGRGHPRDPQGNVFATWERTQTRSPVCAVAGD